ncbi:Galactose-1-phosphate uridylyltransferase [Caligus rogercresseyi]|uniref:RNA-directed DNA polymerase n=1 Tax=Caligus rogercresseyi TaxID=217165 RepID=A0A7T8QRT6_CALRO|nr:Galactose-1-phosphate uridylyltransferase [Caligus rogercresseyi]
MSTTKDEGEGAVDLTSVARVAIRTPDFSIEDPSFYFDILESQFKLQGVLADSTKFHHAITGLPFNVARKISKETRTSSSYVKLKADILEVFEKSKGQLFEELIGTSTMIGKPSEYLKSLNETALKIGVPEAMVKHKFLSAAPSEISPVLVSRSEDSIDQLGRLADQLYEMLSLRPVNSINSATPRPERRTGSREFKSLSLTPFFPDQRPKVCRAHLFYGLKANSCKPWCVFPKSKQSSISIEPSSRMNLAANSLPFIKIAAQINNSTKVDVLIDTGATISLLPISKVSVNSLNPSPVKLVAANGEPIEVFGELTTVVGIKPLRRNYPWNFVVANVTNPIIGIDFLHHFEFLIDCKNGTLSDPKTGNLTSGIPISKDGIFTIKQAFEISESSIKHLFNKYPYLTVSYSSGSPIEFPPDVHHRIDTGSSPSSSSKFRRLSPEKTKICRETLNSLLESGIIRSSSSSWASPLHFVKKKQPGQWRMVGDYRALNAKTIPDKYPLPHMNDLASRLHGSKLYSKIDLCQAYYNIPVDEGDKHKTAITTPFGLYEFNYLPFGLRNAGSTFQRFMNKILNKFSFTFTYLDDILIFSSNKEEHLEHIELVLKTLNQFKLRVAVEKCEFFKENIEFLGVQIAQNGISPSKNKLSVIKSFQKPVSPSELRRFLGMIGFYRHLIPNFADLVLPLTEMIRVSDMKKDLIWTEKEISSFEETKNRLDSICCLPFLDPECNIFHLVTDASNYAVGAALHQIVDGKASPVQFFSKKLCQAQCKYSTFDRELLGAYLSVLHFKHLIEGQNTTIFTDHKPLEAAFHSQKQAKSDRQQRHLSIITEFVQDVQYIRGRDNIVADYLSRPIESVEEVPVSIDLPQISRAQTLALSQEEEFGTYYEEFIHQFKKIKISDSLELICETSIPSPRPYVPKSLRKDIFALFHNLSHPSGKSSSIIIKARYFWPSMGKEIKTWASECVRCQRSKVGRHTKTNIQPFYAGGRFQTIHLDIVGPLPPVEIPGQAAFLPYKYILTCIDRATRWIEVCPLTDITATTIAHAFIYTWISRFGVPLYVITDRGRQFESELFHHLSIMVGFHRIRTTSYHPQTNGMIERVHRVIKSALKAKESKWYFALPIVILGLRMTPSANSIPPFTAVTGSEIMIPSSLVSESKNPHEIVDREFITNLGEYFNNIDFSILSEGSNHSSKSQYLPKDLMKANYVWIRVDRVKGPLEAPYTGPAKVISRNHHTFRIEYLSGKQDVVSIERLKPAIYNPEPTKLKLPSKKLDSTKLSELSTLEDQRPESHSRNYNTKFGRKVKFIIP